LAVFVDGMAFPNFGGFFPPDFIDEIGGAGEWPLGPVFHITVFHGIVMDVVHGGPKMIVATHSSIGGGMPNFATASGFFAIPSE